MRTSRRWDAALPTGTRASGSAAAQACRFGDLASSTRRYDTCTRIGREDYDMRSRRERSRSRGTSTIPTLIFTIGAMGLVAYPMTQVLHQVGNRHAQDSERAYAATRQQTQTQ
jgi:hypothetical protein